MQPLDIHSNSQSNNTLSAFSGPCAPKYVVLPRLKMRTALPGEQRRQKTAISIDLKDEISSVASVN